MSLSLDTALSDSAIRRLNDTLFSNQAMFSGEGERVDLIARVSTSEAKGAVEKWLLQVEEVMVSSVREEVARSRLVRSAPATPTHTRSRGRRVLQRACVHRPIRRPSEVSG